MKKLLVPLVFSVLLLGGNILAQQVYADDILYGISVFENNFSVIDQTTGLDISSGPITLAGHTVSGGTGLAIDPTTGKIYALLKASGFSGFRALVTIDPNTRVATLVGDGNTGDRFADIAFKPDGTLLGVTGDGADTPETLFTLDKTNASSLLLCTLGNGFEGETIAVDSSGIIYHGSGISDGDQLLEIVNPDCSTTNIVTYASNSDEWTALVFWPSQNVLLAQDRSNDLQKVDLGTGFRTFHSGIDPDRDRYFGGLAFVTHAIGGTLLPLDTTALLLAGAQSTTWMIPVVLSGVGIGLFIVSRKN